MYKRQVQNNNNINVKCDVTENDLMRVKNELRGEIQRKFTGVTERVIVTRDMYNQIELENFNHENRVIDPMSFLNHTREYNHFSNQNWEIQLTKIVKCFKGNSIVWAEAHRLEWDNFETFERAFKGKFWPEEEQESLRSRIMGVGNFIGHNNITMYVTKLYNEAKYLEPPIPCLLYTSRCV